MVTTAWRLQSPLRAVHLGPGQLAQHILLLHSSRPRVFSPGGPLFRNWVSLVRPMLPLSCFSHLFALFIHFLCDHRRWLRFIFGFADLIFFIMRLTFLLLVWV